MPGATRIWLGAAQAIPQVNVLTPTAVASAVYTVTINGKSVSYTAGASPTVATVTAGLAGALNATAEPEFREITWQDTTSTVQATGPNDGGPFTQTSAATGGASLTTTTPTSGSGPNYWSVGANWSGGFAPVAGDDALIDQTSSVSILYGLGQSAITLANLNIGAGFTGTIGLPTRNVNGYVEYLPTYLSIAATNARIGMGIGQGSGRIKLDTGTVATALNVYATGAPIETGLESLLWKGNSASNTVNVISGNVGLCVLAGETGTVNTLKLGIGSGGAVPRVRSGPVMTLLNLTQGGGEMEINSGVGTINKVAGILVANGINASVGTFNHDGGSTDWRQAGSISVLNNTGDIDFRADPRTHTITNCNMYKGSSFLDSLSSVAFTNPFVCVRCSLADLKAIDLGVNRNYAVT
jgi:hypothetical protein